MGLPMDYFTSVVSIQAQGSTQQAQLAAAKDLSAELGKLGIKIGVHGSTRFSG